MNSSGAWGMQYAGPSRPPSPVPSTHPVISLLYEPIPLLPSISFWAGGGGGGEASAVFIFMHWES